MRPITKEDIKNWRGTWDNIKVFKPDEVLGITVSIGFYHAYAANENGLPKWVSGRTLAKRRKLGFPKKRKMKPKQMLQDGPFSLDEMAIAEAIINGG